jgi:hypothetical protein
MQMPESIVLEQIRLISYPPEVYAMNLFSESNNRASGSGVRRQRSKCGRAVQDKLFEREIVLFSSFECPSFGHERVPG